MWVYTLLNVDRAVPEVWGSTYDIRDLLHATIALRDGKPLYDGRMDNPTVDMIVKAGLKKIKNTEIEKLLATKTAVNMAGKAKEQVQKLPDETQKAAGAVAVVTALVAGISHIRRRK